MTTVSLINTKTMVADNVLMLALLSGEHESIHSEPILNMPLFMCNDAVSRTVTYAVQMQLTCILLNTQHSI